MFTPPLAVYVCVRLYTAYCVHPSVHPSQPAIPSQIVLSVVDRRQRPEVPPPGVVQGGPPLQYQEYVALMQECWAQEPAARPSFDAVIRRVRALLAVEGGAG